MWKKILVSVVILAIVFLFSAEAREYSDYLILPPQPQHYIKSQSNSFVGSCSVDEIASIPHSIYKYNGLVNRKSVFIEDLKNRTPLQVSVEEQLNLEADLIFSGIEKKEDGYYHVGEFMAEGAKGIRLIIDIGSLKKGETLWVVEPKVLTVFGPYTVDNYGNGEIWSPTIFKKNVILVLKTQEATLPQIFLKSIHYYFLSFFDLSKAMSCPLPAHCIEDEVYKQLTTAYGFMLIPLRKEGAYACTGGLLNVMATEDIYEPYFLTANHCFGNSDNVVWESIEIFWDFTSFTCEESLTETIFDTDRSLLRTTGARNLVSAECLDSQLIELTGKIPIGERGRAFLGWDSGEVQKGFRIYGSHYYKGSLLKGVIGKVTNPDMVGSMDIYGFDKRYHMIEVLWDEGVTTNGSSGFPALCREWDYRVVGVLSNGPTHNCVDRSNNYDYLASFRYFYPLIRCYLLPGSKCETVPDCEQDDSCFLKYLLVNDHEKLDFFRNIRSWFLYQGEWGKRMVEFYYQQSPIWINIIRDNPNMLDTLRMIVK